MPFGDRMQHFDQLLESEAYRAAKLHTEQRQDEGTKLAIGIGSLRDRNSDRRECFHKVDPSRFDFLIRFNCVPDFAELVEASPGVLFCSAPQLGALLDLLLAQLQSPTYYIKVAGTLACYIQRELVEPANALRPPMLQLLAVEIGLP